MRPPFEIRNHLTRLGILQLAVTLICCGAEAPEPAGKGQGEKANQASPGPQSTQNNQRVSRSGSRPALSAEEGRVAVGLVIQHVETDKLYDVAEGADRGHFKAIANPHGTGILVFFDSPGTVYQSVAWIVSEKGKPFALTEGTQYVTPDLPLPQAADIQGSGFDGLSMGDALKKFKNAVRNNSRSAVAATKAGSLPEPTCQELLQTTKDLRSALAELASSASVAKTVVALRPKLEAIEYSVPDHCGRRLKKVCDLLWAVSAGLVIIADVVGLGESDERSLRIQVELQAEDFERKLLPALRNAGCN